MKKYNEFNEAEQTAIKTLNSAYICAEYADSFNDTLREEAKALKYFNTTFGYDFRKFEFTYHKENIKETWFE